MIGLKVSLELTLGTVIAFVFKIIFALRVLTLILNNLIYVFF